MAIVQVSRITNRKGLQIDLPQLAGAELGWSIDTRQLYIGNGTLEEGAPVIGNTEILTEFSDILNIASTYTYKGEAAGYIVQTGPTTGTPVVQTLQSWLDQFATVKDFGAVGDGVTDDTDAINRALFQLYCVETNPQIRRSLFFPAGVYRVSESIVVPPYATLYGEGADASIIQMQSGDDSALNAYVVRTGDSLQQTGVNLGNNGATLPQYVTITNMGFETLDPDTLAVLYIENLSNSSFNNCTFMGPYDTADITSNLDNKALSGVAIESTGTPLQVSNVTLDRCVYSGCTWGIYNSLTNIDSVHVTNGNFDTLWAGISIDTAGTTGIRILHNRFDNIYDYGVYLDTSDSGTGYNLFLDVANGFAGAGSPINYVEQLYNSCVSFGDMFARDDTDAETWPRIVLSGSSITTTNGQQLQMGTYTRQSGATFTLINDTGSPTTIQSYTDNALSINYTIVRGTLYRTGTLVITNANPPVYTDDYSETASTGVTLTVTESSGTLTLKYTTTDIGQNATLYYSTTVLA